MDIDSRQLATNNCGSTDTLAVPQRYEPPPMRDRLPTLPEDLSEYAWLHTGPESWSAATSGLVLDSSDLEECEDDGEVETSEHEHEHEHETFGGDELIDDDGDDSGDSDEDDDDDVDDDDGDDLRHMRGLDDMTAGLLVDLWHNDVPHLHDHDASVVDEREAHLLSLMDGQSTVGLLLEASALPVPDVLGTLCELCARGVVTLDRSGRRASSAPSSIE